jgi:hypothetical protein
MITAVAAKDGFVVSNWGLVDPAWLTPDRIVFGVLAATDRQRGSFGKWPRFNPRGYLIKIPSRRARG